MHDEEEEETAHYTTTTTTTKTHAIISPSKGKERDYKVISKIRDPITHNDDNKTKEEEEEKKGANLLFMFVSSRIGDISCAKQYKTMGARSFACVCCLCAVRIAQSSDDGGIIP